MLGGMPKSQEKVITKIKWVCSSKVMEKSSRNSNARGHAQITKKGDIQVKVSMP
jgi:hypothetical protein